MLILNNIYSPLVNSLNKEKSDVVKVYKESDIIEVLSKLQNKTDIRHFDEWSLIAERDYNFTNSQYHIVYTISFDYDEGFNYNGITQVNISSDNLETLYKKINNLFPEL